MGRASGFLIAIILSLAFIFSVSSCAQYQDYDTSREAQGLESPPPWETARGIGQEFHYYYYPQVKIYYNLEKKVYFYYYEGQWQVASQLPSGYRTSGKRVKLGMGEEEPFKWQAEIEKKYPPETQ